MMVLVKIGEHFLNSNPHYQEVIRKLEGTYIEISETSHYSDTFTIKGGEFNGREIIYLDVSHFIDDELAGKFKCCSCGSVNDTANYNCGCRNRKMKEIFGSSIMKNHHGIDELMDDEFSDMLKPERGL